MTDTPIHLTEGELEDLLTRAARRGAREAVVALLGIDENDSSLRKDFTELRDLLDAVRHLKRGVVQSVGRLIGYGLLVLIGALALSVTNGGWNPFKPH